MGRARALEPGHVGSHDGLLLLGAADVEAMLRGRERELVAVVSDAYRAFDRGEASLPHSSFLRFPERPRDRIIALPAWLGGRFDAAGIKWIASVPENHARNLDRASALIVLNDAGTGRPVAVLEGSLVSAARTAASAALAASVLAPAGRCEAVGLVGCGPIAFETLRFLRVMRPELEAVVVHDRLPERARRFAELADRVLGVGKVSLAASPSDALTDRALVVLATSATEPHLDDLSACRPGAVVLHLSLRDLAPGVLLGCRNVVDDFEHATRAGTSLEGALALAGPDGLDCTPLAAWLRDDPAPTPPQDRPIVFAPFGLGVLDIALAVDLVARASGAGRGMRLPDFLPDYWARRVEASPVRTTA